MDDDGEDEDSIDEMDKDVDEETTSPYKQKFIREHRQLFSKSLNPSRYLKCFH